MAKKPFFRFDVYTYAFSGRKSLLHTKSLVQNNSEVLLAKKPFFRFDVYTYAFTGRKSLLHPKSLVQNNSEVLLAKKPFFRFDVYTFSHKKTPLLFQRNGVLLIVVLFYCFAPSSNFSRTFTVAAKQSARPLTSILSYVSRLV